MASHPRSFLRRAALALVVTLVSVGLLELLARGAIAAGMALLLPPSVRIWVDTHRVVFDRELGWRPAVSVSAIEGSHFQTRVRAPEAPRSGLLGYAFGDSQTHGAGIAEGRAWPAVAEETLRADGVPVTIRNLGSSGYRSAQVLRLLEVHVLPMNPDFLVVDCMARDSIPLPRHQLPRFADARAALFESRLYRLLWIGVAAARGQNLGAIGNVRIEQDDRSGAGNHAEIAELAAKHGIPLVFVDYPFMDSPARSLAPRESLPPGVPVVEATRALVESGASAEELFLENNHLTVKGSEIVGREVARTLQTVLPQP